jgi:hypothetical protein
MPEVNPGNNLPPVTNRVAAMAGFQRRHVVGLATATITV